MVAEGAQLVDRYDAGMLQLAGDLGFLDEAANHLGFIAMRFEKNLHRQVAPEVGVTALENGSHAAASNLTEELNRVERSDGSGISGDDGRITGPGSVIESASRSRTGGMLPNASPNEARRSTRPART